MLSKIVCLENGYMYYGTKFYSDRNNRCGWWWKYLNANCQRSLFSQTLEWSRLLTTSIRIQASSVYIIELRFRSFFSSDLMLEFSKVSFVRIMSRYSLITANITHDYYRNWSGYLWSKHFMSICLSCRTKFSLFTALEFKIFEWINQFGKVFEKQCSYSYKIYYLPVISCDWLLACL